MPVRKRLNWLIQRGTIGTPTSRSLCARRWSHRACRPEYEVTISNLDVAAGSRSCTALTSLLISSTAVCTSRLNSLTTVLTGTQPRRQGGTGARPRGDVEGRDRHFVFGTARP